LIIVSISRAHHNRKQFTFINIVKIILIYFYLNTLFVYFVYFIVILHGENFVSKITMFSSNREL